MLEVIRREVEELHRFFQDWMTGRIPPDAEVFLRLSTALHPEFEMVTPEGEVVAREELLASLRGAHGGRGGAGPSELFRIWIDGVRSREVAEAPNGVVWLHVHEVWLPSPAGAGSESG